MKTIKIALIGIAGLAVASCGSEQTQTVVTEDGVATVTTGGDTASELPDG